jgi:hypothetical protein
MKARVVLRPLHRVMRAGALIAAVLEEVDSRFRDQTNSEGRVATSVPPSPRPIFKPREFKTAAESYWYVEAEWADGTIEEIGQFKSITEAWDWIARQSRAWLDSRG